MAPSMMASWTMATIIPPPASASCGSALASHVHQPTGADVATSPQTPSKTAVTGTDHPEAMSATAMAANKTGMMANV